MHPLAAIIVALIADRDDTGEGLVQAASVSRVPAACYCNGRRKIGNPLTKGPLLLTGGDFDVDESYIHLCAMSVAASCVCLMRG